MSSPAPGPTKSPPYPHISYGRLIVIMDQNKQSPARLQGSLHQRILEAVRVTPVGHSLYGRRMSIAEGCEVKDTFKS